MVGESVAPAAGLTLALIAGGICVGLAARARIRGHRGVRTPAADAVALAVGAAISFGASLYAAGRAGADAALGWVVLSARLIGSAFVTLPLALTGRLRLTRQALPLVAISGVCEVLGFLAYTAGARHGIAVAAVLSSQFGALAALVGYLLFKDQLSPDAGGRRRGGAVGVAVAQRAPRLSALVTKRLPEKTNILARQAQPEHEVAHAHAHRSG